MSAEQKFEKLLDRLEQIVNRLEKVKSGGGQTEDDSSSNEALSKYDEYVDTYVKPFLDSAKKIGDDLTPLVC